MEASFRIPGFGEADVADKEATGKSVATETEEPRVRERHLEEVTNQRRSGRGSF